MGRSYVDKQSQNPVRPAIGKGLRYALDAFGEANGASCYMAPHPVKECQICGLRGAWHATQIISTRTRDPVA
jgi:hypothetical protein